MRKKLGLLLLALLLLLLLAPPSLRAQVQDETGATGHYTPDRSASATLGALNAAVTVRVTGRAGVGVYITTANLNAVVTPESSVDGTTWFASSFVSSAGAVASSLTFSGGADTQYHGVSLLPGAQWARARVSTYTSGTSSALARVGETGGMFVRAIPVGTTPVSGTLAVTQSTSPWVVGDGSGALNVIVDSSALPSGAATLAEQQTQTTALQLIDNLPNTQGSTTAGQSGALVQGAVTTAAPSYTTAQTSPLSLGVDGFLRAQVRGPLPRDTTPAGQSANPIVIGGIATATIPGPVTNGNHVDAWFTRSGLQMVVGASTGGLPGVVAEDATSASAEGVTPIGAVRKDGSSQLTNADTDYTALAADAYGVLSVTARHPNAIRCTVEVSTATTLTAVGGSCAAPGAGLSLYITDIQVSASAAGIAADAFPTLKYGTGGTCGTGTTIFWGALSAAAIVGLPSNFSTPIKIPANNEICWISSTAGSKFWVILGFVAP